MSIEGRHAFNPPRDISAARWKGGSLVYYPGDMPGDHYFVDSNSGADTNTGITWENALATIDAAVNKCTANNGDVIMVHPAHAENLAAASAVDIDVAGVTVWGIRRGQQMPTLTATATAGDLKMAAANATIHNIRFLGGIDATTGVIEVGAADCGIYDCEYRDATGQATDVLTVLASSDRLHIKGWRHMGAAADGGDSSISMVDSDDVLIEDFWIYGNFDVGAIECRTTASTRLRVKDGTIWTEGGEDLAVADTITGSTGIIGPNLYVMLKDNAANITEAVAGATFAFMDPIYICNLAGEKAMLTNITASTHA
jgi:hypothetical protein